MVNLLLRKEDGFYSQLGCEPRGSIMSMLLSLVRSTCLDVVLQLPSLMVVTLKLNIIIVMISGQFVQMVHHDLDIPLDFLSCKPALTGLPSRF